MQLEQLQPVINWISLHTTQASLIVFLVAFLESLAVFGLLIPGSVFMVAIGTLIGSGILPLWATVIAGILGAIVGDGLSYMLGYCYHHSIRECWPINRFPNGLKCGEVFFEKHGGKSIVLGRFVGPVRAFIPFIVGTLRLSPQRFFPISILAGSLWTIAHLLPGMLLGAASEALAPKVITMLILWCLAIIGGIWVCVRIIRIIINGLSHWSLRALHTFWKATDDHPLVQRLSVWLNKPQQKDYQQLNLIVFFISTVMVFIALMLTIKFYGSQNNINLAVYYLFRSFRNETSDQFFLAVTFFGNKSVYIALLITVFMWLSWRKNGWVAIHWLCNGILSIGSNWAIKHWIQSPRPPGLLHAPLGWSFPSGHATLGVAFLGFLLVILSPHSPVVRKKLSFFFVGLMVSLIAISRLYLGAHWLTDVVGGILLGLSCVMLTTLSYQRKDTLLPKATGILIVCILTFGTVVSISLYHAYPTEKSHFTLVWPKEYLSMETWWSQNGITLPHYRRNLLGYPAESLTLQWARPLHEIEERLKKEGWNYGPALTMENLIHRMGNPGENHHLPLLPKLFEGETPALYMAKYMPHFPTYWVIQLWDSNHIVSIGDRKQVIWIGSVVSKPNKSHNGWRQHNIHSTPPTVSIPDLLKPYLKDRDWKETQFCLRKRHKNYCREVLLIR